MNAENFINNFGHLVNAPEGSMRIRELILQLAFSGDLTIRDAGDEHALAVFDLNQRTKAEWISEGKVRQQPALNTLSVAEHPWELPETWLWCRLGEVTTYGSTDKAEFVDSTPETWVLELEDIEKDTSRLLAKVRAKERRFQSSKNRFAEGDVLYGKLRPYLDKVVLADEDGVCTTEIIPIAIYSGILSEYLRWFLKSPFFKAYANGSTHGMNLPRMGTEAGRNAVFPLAPLAEQKRIVAKVDELMALCDQLEAQQQERERRFPVLSRACHARFAEAPTPANLNHIFDETGKVSPTDLRRSIVNLAIQGRLVRQLEGDESVDVLLARCETERAKIGRTSPDQGPPDASVHGRNIPETWKWKRLDDLLIAGPTNGISPKAVEHETATRSLTLSATTSGWFKEEHSKFIEVEVPEDSDLWLRHGDILVQRGNSIEYVGVAAVYFGKDDQFVYPDLMMRCRIASELDVRFIHLVMNQDASRDYLRARATGTSGSMPKINQATLKSLPIPVPPLAEQHRIVAKVDELMALVDHLEAQQQERDKVAKACVASFAGTHNKKPELMKQPSMPRPSKNIFAPKSGVTDIRGLVLREFHMESGYRSLGDPACVFHEGIDVQEEPAPICLVGLNGSGKSNLIEAIADVFCFLELINLPWNSVKSASSRYRMNDHKFELTYSILVDGGSKLDHIRKSKKAGADFYVVAEDGSETIVEDAFDRLALLPRRIIGYSSGLNETLSHTFLRTRTLYSEEVRDAAPPVGSPLSESGIVYDTRTLYMDYENNAVILLCNYIFLNEVDMKLFKEFTRVSGVSSFELRFNRKIAGKSGPNGIARITEELSSYLGSFARCAKQKFDSDKLAHQFSYTLDDETRLRFQKEFKTAERLFLAMYKWSLLNALVLSDSQRKVFLREDVTKGTLERPPVVPPKDRLFDVTDVKVNLLQPKKEIDYSGLSDGEHQFVQVFGTILLFNAPGTLFLLDEPESHFNPEWRTRFNSVLDRISNSSTHEYVISTHSPYIVSGARRGNVFKFVRKGAQVTCNPVDFETYGASFDALLGKLFSIRSLIDESARDELGEILKRGKLSEMESAVGDFAESFEKRRLYEAILKKQNRKS